MSLHICWKAVVDSEGWAQKTIGSQMFQVQSHPCSNLEMGQQRHGESASLMIETTESIEKGKELRSL